MSEFTIHTIESAPAEVKEVLETVQKDNGGYNPGSTYNGMFVFKMVKGFRGYLIKVKDAGGKKKPPKYHYISPINK